MSTTTAPGPSASATASAGRRVPRAWLVVGGVVLVTFLALLVWGRQDTENTTPLDPDNARPEGARAVARVLAAEGVPVTVARGRDELQAAGVDSTTTVVVTSSDELGPSTVRHLLDRGAGRTVVVAPPARVAQALGSSADPVRTELGDPVRGACSDTRLDGLRLYARSPDSYLAGGCFGVGGGRAVLVSPVPGVEILGAGDVLANGHVTASDNAAIALRLLGGTERVVWYVADSTDLPVEENVGLGEALPDWLAPVLRLLMAVAVAVIVWRVRRFGPLAVEPLPVHVRAIESTVGRGRSYRRSGDRDHVAGVLRTSARRRLADLLLVDRHDEDALVAAAAARSSRTTEEVRALVGAASPTPSTDAALVRLAQELAALTEEVRQP